MSQLHYISIQHYLSSQYARREMHETVHYKPDLATGREVSWRRRAQIKQLAGPMTERQMEHRKSCLVLSARWLSHHARVRSLLLHCTRRNFWPVKNSGPWVCRSHQESIISSRKHLDRRNNNTRSRSEIFTPNSKSNLESVGSEIGPVYCSHHNLQTYWTVKAWLHDSLADRLGVLKQPSTHGQVVNSPTSLKFNLLRQFLVNGAKMLNLFLWTKSPLVNSSGAMIPHFPSPFHPLSLNIHIQILQETDLHTFPYRISWENLFKDQSIFP